MKKFVALFMALLLVLSLAGCTGGSTSGTSSTQEMGGASSVGSTPASSQENAGTSTAGDEVMTYEEYIAADLNTKVVVETYVQAKQDWWENKATLYTQDEDGAYFLYDIACSEEDYNKLTEGTKIRVTGYKSEWSGEVEITGGTFEIIDGNFVATPVDATAWLGTDELIKHQNERVTFTGLKVETSKDANGKESAFLYNWNGSGAEGTDSDLYFNASVNGKTYTFVVEYYLCNEETDVYKAVQNLQVGDTIDLEGFLYWYEGPNPHITSLTVTG